MCVPSRCCCFLCCYWCCCCFSCSFLCCLRYCWYLYCYLGVCGFFRDVVDVLVDLVGVFAFFFFVILFDVFGALDASGLLLFVSVRGFFLMLLAYVWKFFMFMHMLIAFLEILVVFLLMLLAFSWMLLIFFLDVSFGVFDANFCIGVAVAAVLNTPY